MFGKNNAGNKCRECDQGKRPVPHIVTLFYYLIEFKGWSKSLFEKLDNKFRNIVNIDKEPVNRF